MGSQKQEQKRKFRGIWIPREIWLDQGMTLIEKALLAEIDSLDFNDKGCFATNEYFAEFFQIGKRQIKRYINRLAKVGYVVIENPNSKKRKIRPSGVQSLFIPIVNGDKNVTVRVSKMSPFSSLRREEDNKDYNIASASPNAVNGFDHKEYLIKMLNDKEEHVQVIGVWADEMFESRRLVPWQTKEQAEEFVRRHVRVAKELKVYSPAQIRGAIQQLLNTKIRGRDIDFTLEAVRRWIDRPVGQR